MTNTLMHRWFEEVWNKRRPEAIDEMLAPNCNIHGLQGADCSTAFKAFHKDLLDQFPHHLTINVTNVKVNGNWYSADCMVNGTHVKGAAVDFTGQVEARVNKDGKIVEAKNAFDFDKMEKQIKAFKG